MPRQGDNQSVTPGYEAVQKLRFLVISCNGWADSLSNPVTASVIYSTSVFNDIQCDLRLEFISYYRMLTL